MNYHKMLMTVDPTPDPTIAVTSWSIAETVQIIATHGQMSTILTLSPDLANRLAWALIEATGVDTRDDNPDAS